MSEKVNESVLKEIELIEQISPEIKRLGKNRFTSPLHIPDSYMVKETESVYAFIDTSSVRFFIDKKKNVPLLEKAGIRKNLFFKPGETTSAIVTCGGICPGLNAVIQGIVKMNHYHGGGQRTLGISYGYAGLSGKHPVVHLTPSMVENIQSQGGTILGTSRGPQDPVKMVDRLEELDINILYTIGGDGTQRGARSIVQEIERRGLPISVIGVPKTIDNDVYFVDRTFGTETAVAEACRILDSAYAESQSVYNGIGIVKVMGRESGFIAANATLASNQVDFCLIPEITFTLEGKNGLLAQIERRLLEREHIVIVVAEGAGQDMLQKNKEPEYDASGNLKLQDIGLFLKQKIGEHFTKKGINHSIKYIDPSYTIRSCGPTANDSIFCSQLAQMAVHAGMSGRTDMIVGYRNGTFVHLPMELVTARRKTISLHGQLWKSVLEETGQEF